MACVLVGLSPATALPRPSTPDASLTVKNPLPPKESVPKESVADVLQTILDGVASRNNCSLSITVRSATPGVLGGLGCAGKADLRCSRAAGIVDRAKKTPAKVSDRYMWASVGKTFTAAAIMQFVANGSLSLDDRASKYVDPYLSKALDGRYAYHSMEVLFSLDESSEPQPKPFWYNASDITIRDLLMMKSGISVSIDADGYRHLQYHHPEADFSPFDILDIAHGPMNYPAGGPITNYWERGIHMDTNYCDVNFVLLGAARL